MWQNTPVPDVYLVTLQVTLYLVWLSATVHQHISFDCPPPPPPPKKKKTKQQLKTKQQQQKTLYYWVYGGLKHGKSKTVVNETQAEIHWMDQEGEN